MGQVFKHLFGNMQRSFQISKATLICFGRFAKTHYVADELSKEIKERKLNKVPLEELVDISEQLEPHHSLSRYPGISQTRSGYLQKSMVEKQRKMLYITQKKQFP